VKPKELFDLCMDAIDRFNRGEVLADKPFVMLTIPRQQKYCRRTDGGLDVVAYFPAVPTVQALGEAMGVKVKVRRALTPDDGEVGHGQAD